MELTKASLVGELFNVGNSVYEKEIAFRNFYTYIYDEDIDIMAYLY